MSLFSLALRGPAALCFSVLFLFATNVSLVVLGASPTKTKRGDLLLRCLQAAKNRPPGVTPRMTPPVAPQPAPPEPPVASPAWRPRPPAAPVVPQRGGSATPAAELRARQDGVAAAAGGTVADGSGDDGMRSFDHQQSDRDIIDAGASPDRTSGPPHQGSALGSESFSSDEQVNAKKADHADPCAARRSVTNVDHHPWCCGDGDPWCCGHHPCREHPCRMVYQDGGGPSSSSHEISRRPQSRLYQSMRKIHRCVFF